MHEHFSGSKQFRPAKTPLLDIEATPQHIPALFYAPLVGRAAIHRETAIFDSSTRSRFI
jgi:hypothetical protein